MSTSLAERRFLHLWFQFLPTDRLACERSKNLATPYATVEKVDNALRIASVNRAAQDAGIARGAPLAQARAQVPALRVEPADPTADADALVTLARAADRYTPLVGLDPPLGLFLDVTGCVHLFGDEEGLVADAAARFARWGYSVRTAVAGSPAAAWAVARYGPGGVVPAGADAEAMASLPVEALRLPGEITAVLARLGVKTVAQLLRQPRAPLVRRFGPLLARRIDQAEGRDGEPITPLAPVAPFVVERRFAEPLMEMPAVEAALVALAGRLSRGLFARGRGARRIGLRLFHADGAVRDVLVGASEPLVDEARIAALVRPRLDALSARIESESGIDLMRLHAGEIEVRVARQADFAGADAARADFARLVDTLSERLGSAAVQRLLPADTHQPGAADARAPAREAIAPPPWPHRGHDAPPRRPLRLFAQPEPVETLASVPDGPPVRFVWRRVSYHVAAAEGPERIAPNWWEAGAATLTVDYFRVEDVEGRRFWMFRRGLYGEETGPRWFVHGLFA